MRAAVMRNLKIVTDEMPDPIPGPGEVLVKTLACGICGSDLHALKHAKQFVDNAPGGMGMDIGRDVVMGHEFCAEILDYGPQTTRTHPVGTRVCSFPMLLRNGAPVTVGYSNDVPGGYAERMVLMEGLLLPVPNGLAHRTRSSDRADGGGIARGRDGETDQRRRTARDRLRTDRSRGDQRAQDARCAPDHRGGLFADASQARGTARRRHRARSGEDVAVHELARSGGNHSRWRSAAR